MTLNEFSGEIFFSNTHATVPDTDIFRNLKHLFFSIYSGKQNQGKADKSIWCKANDEADFSKKT